MGLDSNGTYLSFFVNNRNNRGQTTINDALHWGRIAAKCDQSEPKELLLVLLLQRQAEDVIKIETDALLVSIEKIDSKRASSPKVSRTQTAW